MAEIAITFRRIERANVRPDTSVQSLDRSLGGLAQESLERMEHQLDGVKVRRILRQVAQACASSPDRFLYASNLMECYVVGHDNVATLERRGQTLLYVSQECFAIHGSFDQHGSHDAGLTQAGDKRHRLPVAHRRVRDQPLSARVPTVKAYHVGRDCRFVDEHEASRVKPALLTDPASTRASHVGALALLRPQAFFERDAMASEETRQCAAACRDTSLTQSRNELIQRKVPLLADKVENLLRILLQRRRAPSTGHRLERPIFVKTLQPADRGTCADLEVFGSITSRSPCFHELNHAYSQVSRIRSPHWSNPAVSMRQTRASGGLWESRFTP